MVVSCHIDNKIIAFGTNREKDVETIKNNFAQLFSD